LFEHGAEALHQRMPGGQFRRLRQQGGQRRLFAGVKVFWQANAEAADTDAPAPCLARWYLRLLRRSPRLQGGVEQRGTPHVALLDEFAVELRDVVAACLPAVLEIGDKRGQRRRGESPRPWAAGALGRCLLGQREQAPHRLAMQASLPRDLPQALAA